jgi:cation:H+ antiporter
MLTALAATLIGLVALVRSADAFVHGSAGLALRLGMTPATVGLTLVALGTSAPEILISATAALTDSPGLAVANALGSNIANTGLVLGAAIALAPLAVARTSRVRDLPACIVVTLLAGALLFDRHLGFPEGLILLAVLALVLLLLWRFPDAQLVEEAEEEMAREQGRAAWVRFLVGLVVLLASARLLVWGATRLALELNVSEELVGLSVVALGTSLPELATAVAAARRGHPGLVLGNVLGSNVLNLLTVLPLPALLAPGLVSAELAGRDYLVMLGMTLFAGLVLTVTGKRPVPRAAGWGLLFLYAAYIGWLGLAGS